MALTVEMNGRKVCSGMRVIVGKLQPFSEEIETRLERERLCDGLVLKWCNMRKEERLYTQVVSVGLLCGGV